MSDEKTSKSNGLGVDPMQRLASFKPPRDYSLGPVKPNKKVFIPNLNVTRNKSKGSSSNNTRDHKKDEKGKRERKNERTREFKNGPNVIKSSGVFSEGLGSRERHYNRSSFGRENSDASPATLQRPTIRVKDVVKIDKELEEQKIKLVMNRGTFGDVEEEEKFNHSTQLQAPIKLPMDDIGWYNSKRKSKVQVKKELIVKTEPPDTDAISLSALETKPLLDLKPESFDDLDVVELLRNTNPTMMLIKLPDTLPGRAVGSEDDGPPRRKAADQPSTANGPTEEEVVEKKCCLSQLAEGKVGKLQIRRSGRVTLRLGDTNLEVSLGTKSAFYQEIVSVGADSASRSARIISLGPLQHKLTIVPDWDAMFLDMPS